jgi:FMN phosphatase YigB (HAD superfamily)
VNYHFAERLYPHAIEVIDRLHRSGRVVILSDGDVVFQPKKVERSGLWGAVSGHVLVIPQERMLDDVERRYPARRYVLVDDKLRILTAVKRVLGERVTTIFVRQGHYARDRALVARFPAADVTIGRIGDLIDLDLEPLVGRPASGANGPR